MGLGRRPAQVQKLVIAAVNAATAASSAHVGGEKLKQIASQARTDMERLFGGKVFLEVWVKVKSGWADDAATLKRLGID